MLYPGFLCLWFCWLLERACVKHVLLTSDALRFAYVFAHSRVVFSTLVFLRIHPNEHQLNVCPQRML